MQFECRYCLTEYGSIDFVLLYFGIEQYQIGIPLDILQNKNKHLNRMGRGNSNDSITNSEYDSPSALSTHRSNTSMTSSLSSSSVSFGNEISMISTVLSLPNATSKANWDDFIVSKIVMLFRKQFLMVSVDKKILFVGMLSF